MTDLAVRRAIDPNGDEWCLLCGEDFRDGSCTYPECANFAAAPVEPEEGLEMARAHLFTPTKSGGCRICEEGLTPEEVDHILEIAAPWFESGSEIATRLAAKLRRIAAGREA